MTGALHATAVEIDGHALLLTGASASGKSDLALRLIDRGEGDSQAKRDFSTGLRQFGLLNLQAPGWRGHVARGWQSLGWRLRR